MDIHEQIKQPKVSVIMNCYNSDQFLKEAIDSVYSQTNNDWEIIFWDNASTDKSAEIAQSYDNRLKYFRGNATVPLGEARNKAIAQASGEFIAFLDCDDIWLPYKLEKQLKIFQSNTDLALVFTNTIKFQNRYEAIDFDKHNSPPSGQIFKYLLKHDFITLSSVMCRLQCLLSLESIFNPIFHVGEDWELWLRLCFYYPAEYMSEPLTKWRINPNSLTHKNFLLYSDETKIIIDILKNLEPQIATEYANELQNLAKTAIYYKGIGFWLNGRNKEARQILQPHIKDSLKFFLAFIVCFLPAQFINSLEKIYFKFHLNRWLSNH